MNSCPNALAPVTVANQLGRADVRVLDHLTYLAHVYQRRCRTKTAYCWPSRAWLATRCRVSIRTITRATTHLANLQLIRRIQRRPEAGRWQTNLYVLIHRSAHLLGTLRRRIAARLDRAPDPAHQPPRSGAAGNAAARRIGTRPPPASAL